MAVEVVVGTLIVNEERKILLTTSPKWKGILVPPGGHIEEGETLEQAARREVKEETGLDVNETKFLRWGELINPPESHRPIHAIYFHFLCKVTGQVKLQESELKEYIWLSLEEALAHPQVRDVFKDTLKVYEAHAPKA